MEGSESLWHNPHFQAGFSVSKGDEGLYGYLDFRQLPALFTQFRKELRQRDIMRQTVAAEIVKRYECATLFWKPAVSTIALEIQIIQRTTGTVDSPAQSVSRNLTTISMPVDIQEALIWIALHARKEIISSLLQIAFSQEDAPIDTEQTDIQKSIVHFADTISGSINIGFALKNVRAKPNDNSILAALLLESDNHGGANESMISNGITLLTAITGQKPESLSIEPYDNNPAGDVKWWFWRKSIFFAAAGHGSRMVLFIPAHFSRRVIESLLAEKGMPVSLPQSMRDLQTIHLYAHVDLERTGIVLEETAQLISMLSGKKIDIEKTKMWGRILTAFRSARIISGERQDSVIHILFLLDS